MARIEDVRPEDYIQAVYSPAFDRLHRLSRGRRVRSFVNVTDGDLELAGNTVYQPLKTVIDAGDYTITYKVVSADGHPISGSVKFTGSAPT